MAMASLTLLTGLALMLGALALMQRGARLTRSHKIAVGGENRL
jgi:hypothetical protein